MSKGGVMRYNHIIKKGFEPLMLDPKSKVLPITLLDCVKNRN